MGTLLISCGFSSKSFTLGHACEYIGSACKSPEGKAHLAHLLQLLLKLLRFHAELVGSDLPRLPSAGGMR